MASPSPPARRPRESAARARILATAHALFYADGVRATGVDRVIERSGVTKVTFYRHFPAKDTLVLAFLEARHVQWMAWFVGALARHGGRPQALVPALREWLASPAYRGCAFVNAVAELGDAVDGVAPIARRHKREMTDAIAATLPASPRRRRDALALALAVDGAIVRAQVEGDARGALDALARLVDAVCPSPEAGAGGGSRAGGRRARPAATRAQASRAASR